MSGSQTTLTAERLGFVRQDSWRAARISTGLPMAENHSAQARTSSTGSLASRQRPPQCQRTGTAGLAPVRLGASRPCYPPSEVG